VEDVNAQEPLTGTNVRNVAAARDVPASWLRDGW
jgi:hypothetical protein